jgi:AcrR family transcriptional regulator
LAKGQADTIIGMPGSTGSPVTGRQELSVSGSASGSTVRPRKGRQSVESKEQSRQRLLDAALHVLETDGEAGLTTMRVANAADLAQSTFYVHFANMEGLLVALVSDELDGWRTATVEAREESRSAPRDAERFRATFRTPINAMSTRPQLFRILQRTRLDPSTTIGRWSAAFHDELRQELVADLRATGFPACKARDRRRLEMIADAVQSMTSELVWGHLDGRYPDVEEIIDVLVAFSHGYLALLPRGTLA